LGRPVVHLEIIGSDPTKLRKFYAELFDWKFGEPMGPEMGHYSLVQPDSAGIGVGVGAEMGGGSRTTAYVEVSDLKATLDQAVAMGGKVLMEPMEIPGVVNFARFSDPEGNVIGLTKPV
jgi:predicted enzyme related to lactoylglutathione lyase